VSGPTPEQIAEIWSKLARLDAAEEQYSLHVADSPWPDDLEEQNFQVTLESELDKARECFIDGDYYARLVLDLLARAEAAEARSKDLGEVLFCLAEQVDMSGYLKNHGDDNFRSAYDNARAALASEGAAAGEMTPGQHLGNLLAIIHRDGGHYQAEHGTQKAVADAIQWASEQHARAEAAEGRVRELEEALKFYAVWEHYHVRSQYLMNEETGRQEWVMPKSETEKDNRGDRARAALAAAEK
jgi:hypothetical protein